MKHVAPSRTRLLPFPLSASDLDNWQENPLPGICIAGLSTHNPWLQWEMNLHAEYVHPPSARYAGGGCFIATAAYGSYFHPFVATLKSFRDRLLMTHPPGRSFVAWYLPHIAPDSGCHTDQCNPEVGDTDTPYSCGGIQLPRAFAGAHSRPSPGFLARRDAVPGDTEVSLPAS